jgi:ferredoxin
MRHADRLLRRLGRSWRAAPARRLVQGAAFLVFLDLFFRVAWPHVRTFHAGLVESKAWLPADLFLRLDPLGGVAAAVAARAASPALGFALAVLGLGLLSPRVFCAYLCPLGTLIDGFDKVVGRRLTRLRLRREQLGGLAHTRYVLLALVLVAAAAGASVAGWVAAIPLLTRGLLLTAGRLQMQLAGFGSQAPPWDGASLLGAGLLAGVLLLGLLGPRFWCRYLCPSGALQSLVSWLRLADRRVGDGCTRCGKCLTVCPFDAITPDFATRTDACAQCQTCAGVCPAGAITFGGRRQPERATEIEAPSRRAFAGAAAGGLVALAGGLSAAAASRPRAMLRPPGAVPEAEFLDRCLRCGECLKVCPGPVLHPAGLAAGFEGIWTPVAVPVRAGCHQDCNACGLVCPTGAIRPLTLEQKRRTPMGLAAIDPATCLPHRGEQDCDLCLKECERAGYHAIELRQIELEIGDIPPGAVSEMELEEMSHIQAPYVQADKCVGCGQCEYRCEAAYVRREQRLKRSAIVVSRLPL